MVTRGSLVLAGAAVLLVVVGVGALFGCGSADESGTSAGEVKIDGVVPRQAIFSSTSYDIAVAGTEDHLGPDYLQIRSGGDAVIADVPGSVRSYAWMPDGRSLAVSYGPTNDARDPDRLAIVSMEGELVRTIEPDTNLVATEGMTAEPNGDWVILAASEPPLETRSDLWRVSLVDGSTENLTNSAEMYDTYPVALEDGRILYTTGVASTDTEDASGWVAVRLPGSGEDQRLTTPCMVTTAAAPLPDGRYVYHGYTTDGEFVGLWIASLDEPGDGRYAGEQPAVRVPSSSFDGRYIVGTVASAEGEVQVLEVDSLEAQASGDETTC